MIESHIRNNPANKGDEAEVEAEAMVSIYKVLLKPKLKFTPFISDDSKYIWRRINISGIT